MLRCAAEALTSHVRPSFTLEHGSCFARSVHQKIKGGHTLPLALPLPIALKGPTQFCHKAVSNISRISNPHYSSNEEKLGLDFNFSSGPRLRACFYLPCAQTKTQQGWEEGPTGDQARYMTLALKLPFQTQIAAFITVSATAAEEIFIFQLDLMRFYYFSLFLTKDQES